MVLYVLTKPTLDPLVQNRTPGQQTSVLLLQDAVLLPEGCADEVFFLQDDAALHHVNPPGKAVSYRGVLDLIFGADRVVVL